jgi:hypothetical protein
VAGIQSPGGEFKSGTKVRHEKFGEGLVVSVDAAGTVSIVFDEVGMKKLSLEYAKLEKVD